MTVQDRFVSNLVADSLQPKCGIFGNIEHRKLTTVFFERLHIVLKLSCSRSDLNGKRIIVTVIVTVVRIIQLCDESWYDGSIDCIFTHLDDAQCLERVKFPAHFVKTVIRLMIFCTDKASTSRGRKSVSDMKNTGGKELETVAREDACGERSKDC